MFSEPTNSTLENESPTEIPGFNLVKAASIADQSTSSATNKSTDTKESPSQVFSQRLAQYRKSLQKQLSFADSIDLRNPQLVAEFAGDIYTSMRE